MARSAFAQFLVVYQLHLFPYWESLLMVTHTFSHFLVGKMRHMGLLLTRIQKPQHLWMLMVGTYDSSAPQAALAAMCF